MRVQMRMDYEMNRQLQSDRDLSLADYHVLDALTDAPGGRRQVSDVAARSEEPVRTTVCAICPAAQAGSQPGRGIWPAAEKRDPRCHPEPSKSMMALDALSLTMIA
jgi:hypothetical protein